MYMHTSERAVPEFSNFVNVEFQHSRATFNSQHSTHNTSSTMASTTDRQFTVMFNKLLQMYNDDNEDEQCAFQAKLMIQDENCPRYHRLRALVLISHATDDYGEALKYYDKAEQFLRLWMRGNAEGENEIANTALEEVRAMLDELKEGLEQEGLRLEAREKEAKEQEAGEQEAEEQEQRRLSDVSDDEQTKASNKEKKDNARDAERREAGVASDRNAGADIAAGEVASQPPAAPSTVCCHLVHARSNQSRVCN
jgi:hypothetical protein